VNLLELLASNLLVTLLLMTALWSVSLILRDVSIVDVFWGLGFIVIAAVTFFLAENDSPRKLLLLGLTAIWGLRLSIHLGVRKWGTPEDHRYQAMREKIGPHFWIVSLGVVFLLQGVIMNIVVLPMIVGQLDNSPLAWLDAIGTIIWCVGMFFEAVGDWQLAAFKADPNNNGKVMDRGLWRYTRHPNYFGDFAVWWGVYIVALGAVGTWWTIVSPLLMSFLLLRVSGVTLLEHSLRERKPDYADYVARTSAFFPWPPMAKKSDV
jgi:steroid 5-alpha reductase family enzyme